MLDSDPDELRAKYLGDFASICHLGPPQVDALLYVDFLQLIFYIDATNKAISDASKPQQQ